MQFTVVVLFVNYPLLLSEDGESMIVVFRGQPLSKVLHPLYC